MVKQESLALKPSLAHLSVSLGVFIMFIIPLHVQPQTYHKHLDYNIFLKPVTKCTISIPLSCTALQPSQRREISSIQSQVSTMHKYELRQKQTHNIPLNQTKNRVYVMYSAKQPRLRREISSSPFTSSLLRTSCCCGDRHYFIPRDIKITEKGSK